MDKKTLNDIDVSNKTVLVRADFNVPIEEEGVEAVAKYDHRLRVTMPTIQYLLDRRSKVVLCSHLGRPKGKVVEALRMAPVADQMGVLLGHPVKALRDCVGPEVQREVSTMKPGDIVMLENLRFNPGEEKNDPEFARALASLADVFVLDAFATAHRAHASIVGVPKHLPTVAGLVMQKEIEVIGKALESPDRPLAAILGGAKISDKLKILENLLGRVNSLFIGGGMAATFLLAQGKQVGDSLVESDMVSTVKVVMERAAKKGVKLHLPSDVVIASEFGPDPARVATVDVGQIPVGMRIMDIGPKTAQSYSDALSRCKTIIWNGPQGVFEYDKFAGGTKAIANTLADLKAVTIIGGGSTAEAVEALGLGHRMTHVSTGGGAMLEFLEGKVLPGVAAIPSK
jgi:phosphoglycerate kinase